MNLPDHLGGHQGQTHVDHGALTYMISKFDVQSMLDIGCGPGGMVEHARSLGLSATGIDGDWTVKPDILCDFTIEPAKALSPYDLAWSVEFLEHVEEQYIINFMPAFSWCKYAVVTYAPPGWPGHHHVNLQEETYWVNVFEHFGWIKLWKATDQIRAASTMKKGYMKRTGLVFERQFIGELE